jgi:hypothetical protein
LDFPDAIDWNCVLQLELDPNRKRAFVEGEGRRTETFPFWLWKQRFSPWSWSISSVFEPGWGLAFWIRDETQLVWLKWKKVKTQFNE